MVRNLFFRPVKSAVLTVWIIRHMWYHVLIGLVYAWILRELWGGISARLIWLAVFGSLVMDADHFLYFFIYGRRESYAQQVKNLLFRRKVRTLFSFWTNNHKNNHGLWSHNVYITGFLLGLSLLSFFKDVETGVILFGSMTLHLLFDIIDDFIQLGELNPNWKRWGRRR